MARRFLRTAALKPIAEIAVLLAKASPDRRTVAATRAMPTAALATVVLQRLDAATPLLPVVVVTTPHPAAVVMQRRVVEADTPAAAVVVRTVAAADVANR